MGSGAEPQELATVCTYNHQSYIENCYFSTKMSIIHFVKTRLEPACDMLATERPTTGTGNSHFLHRWNDGTEQILPGTRNCNGLQPGTCMAGTCTMRSWLMEGEQYAHVTQREAICIKSGPDRTGRH